MHDNSHTVLLNAIPIRFFAPPFRYFSLHHNSITLLDARHITGPYICQTTQIHALPFLYFSAHFQHRTQLFCALLNRCFTIPRQHNSVLLISITKCYCSAPFLNSTELHFSMTKLWLTLLFQYIS